MEAARARLWPLAIRLRRAWACAPRWRIRCGSAPNTRRLIELLPGSSPLSSSFSMCATGPTIYSYPTRSQRFGKVTPKPFHPISYLDLSNIYLWLLWTPLPKETNVSFLLSIWYSPPLTQNNNQSEEIDFLMTRQFNYITFQEDIYSTWHWALKAHCQGLLTHRHTHAHLYIFESNKTLTRTHHFLHV